ncbi:MAG: universal stress protein [Phycisphaerae bacterium]|nr:universal stress protein [Phycisphaerae bacterium]
MKILVAIDFSDSLDAILSEAAKWAGFTHAELWLIHVVESQPDFIAYSPDVGLMGDGVAVGVFADTSQAHQNARDAAARRLREKRYQLQELAEKLQASGVPVTPLLLEGPVIKTILEEAARHEVSMIIVGSHGHGTVHQLLVGSVSEGVLRRSEIPVLVIPTRTAKDDKKVRG